MRARVRHAPTLLVALRQKYAGGPRAKIQSSSYGSSQAARSLKICSKLIGTEGISNLEISQWLQNIFVLHIVREFAGMSWSPGDCV